MFSSGDSAIFSSSYATEPATAWIDASVTANEIKAEINTSIGNATPYTYFRF